jgi:MFS family permease
MAAHGRLQRAAASHRPWWRDIKGPQWKALAAGQIGYALDAFDVMLYAFALPAIAADWQLSPATAGFMISVTLFTSAAGGIVFGAVADRFGRRCAMIVTVLVFSLCSGLSGLARNLLELAIARGLLGLGMGGEWTAGTLLISETWPDRHRGKAIGLMQSGWAIGYIAAALTASLLLPRLGWRAMFFVGVAPALFTLWLRARLDESELWVAQRRTRRLGMIASFAQIFRRDLIRHTALATLVAALVMFAYWGLFSWIPGYLATPVAHQGAGLSIVKAPLWTIPMMIGAFFGYVTFGFVSDRMGRRPTFALYLAVAAALVVAFAGARDTTTLLVLGPPIGFFGSGYFSAFGAIISELFPTRARGAAVGFTYNVGRMASAVAPALIGAVSAGYGFGVALSLTSAAFGLAAIGVFALPETRGRRLV